MNIRPGNVIHSMVRFAELRSAWRRSLGAALHDTLLGAEVRSAGGKPQDREEQVSDTAGKCGCRCECQV